MSPAVRVESPTVTIKPAWASWSDALHTRRSSPARAELGLDTQHPIVFSGHQPIVFHNGILAKLIAQHQAASRTRAARAWVVADQDPVELSELRVPVGRDKYLRQQLVQLLAPGSTPAGVPSASLPAIEPLGVEDARLEELVSYLQGYTQETSLGRQFAHATLQLACDRLGIDLPQIVFSSELLSSDTLWALVERMIDDPGACVEAYNSAVAQHPDARVRALSMSEHETELPLWGLRSGLARVAISTRNIDQFGRHELAPRGLLMSLLVRAHLGELFIHGTGGWAYDQITQQWARDWLGSELTPMALTTATQHLELGFDSAQVTTVADASWAHHHARHTPSMLGDDDAQRRKDQLLKQIAAQQEAGENPDGAYQQLVRLLEDYRMAQRVKLDELKQCVKHARANQKQIELANDRAWPFVLFDDQQLNALRDAVAAALG